ncbi:MAG TPA: hypothetical protein VK691_01635 [Solirubrobacteraceae bacterium]|nr:hypothetical protein [Solirubrobacteraceae bacterium]
MLGSMLTLVWVANASAAEIEWRQGAGALSSTVESESTGTFKLIDSGRSGGAFSLSCSGALTRKVGPGAAGEVTNLNFSLCNTPASECEAGHSIEYEDLNLPWHSELSIVSGKAQDSISSGGKGNPGLRIYCTVGGIPHKLAEECTGKLRIGATNTTSGVEGSFDGEQLSCIAFGVASKGTVEGSLLTTAKSGAALQVTQHENWFQGGKALTGSIATKQSGTIILTVLKGTTKVECKDAGEGSAGVSGLDELTKLSFSSCKLLPGAECDSGTTPTVAALNLPWKSELVLAEGLTPRTHDLSLPGASGSPGFMVRCVVGGILITVSECTASALTMGAKNVGTGVEGAFYGEMPTCTRKFAPSILEGTQLIQATTGSALEVAFP